MQIHFVICVVTLILFLWIILFYRVRFMAIQSIRHEPFFREMVERGRRLARSRKIVFCGLIRDAAHNVPSIIRDAETIGAAFAAYEVLIVENDSHDHTRDLLLQWRKRNPRVTVLGCGHNASECRLQLPRTVNHFSTQSRIAKMVYLRNLYMDALQESRFDDTDYVAVWDFDIGGTFFLEGIFHTIAFLQNRRIDSMAANAYNTSIFPSLADPFAQINVGQGYVYEFHHLHCIPQSLRHPIPQVGDDPIRVWSAFGGFVIYKLQAIRKLRYRVSFRKRIVCEHVAFHAPLRHYINPSMVFHIHANDS
jgi:hypothetical protein